MAAFSPNWKASGNINPSAFVKIDTTKNEYVAAAGVGDKPLAVATEATHYPQGVGAYDGYAAHAGETIEVYSVGEICLLSIGAGGCTAGDYLKPDASGSGVTVNLGTAATTTWFGAVALETALANDLARVFVLPGVFTHL